MGERYACIALDVQKSREYPLQQVEKSLNKLKRELNEQFKESLSIPFDIRMGDELLGVCRSFADAYMIIKQIHKNTELSFYIGCGFGRIDTEDKQNINVSNGSAIVNAIEARDDFVKEGDQEAKIWQISDSNKTFFYSDEFPYQSVNSLYHLIQHYSIKRSEKQQKIVDLVEEYPESTYEDIGERLGYKSPKTSVSNHLKAANFEIVNQSEHALTELLSYHQKVLEK
ncbi:hypothetical protein CEY16_03155 [Halalkalibacillus sediminis]|uniref:Uncharacterized protein n=1 Tax=Halalkalibacillus sediminis TaxID=2018042 RepID=A0A2I0QWT7_9BACI|nr:SatD family protein [Halalkalibacillus sediminis]PKR78769.1 hypothetical protein CEY16_03155 [Halalkalibacillus sediminis]